jgi:hypothetical protein
MRAMTLAALLFAAPLAAQDLSADIARDGLAKTEAALSRATDPADRFALGGVRFLRAVEAVLQTRWQTGMSESLRILPVFRLPIAENPAPDPFDPDLITTAFQELINDMAEARAPLEGLPPDEFAVTLRLDDLWFDLNKDGVRMEGEGALEIAGPMILGWQWASRDPATPAPVVTFDRADADWLRAYTHLLSGIAEVVVAYDPADAIRDTMATRAAMRELRTVQPGEFDMNASLNEAIDALYAVSRALEQNPDSARLMAARDHFLAMVAANRDFWRAVETETDDNNEWLPNARQTAALGLPLPAETGAVWLTVLDDLEKLLRGELLAPYFWLDGTVGVNIARMFTEPAPVDILGWIQGTAALPYLEKGPLISDENWRQFEMIMGGQAMLMSLWLN